MDGCGLRSEGTLSCISSCSPIPSPDLPSCHRCGLRFSISDTIDRFRILDSQWRIVLLCYDCLDDVKSSKVCSYCFLGIPESDKGLLHCIACSCRVHRTCVPLHHRNLLHSQLDTENFICVDCCPVHRFLGETLTKYGPQSGFRFLLEDLVGETNSISEKVTTEGKVRKNTLDRAMVARGSTELTKTAPGAVHSVKQLSHNNTVPDEELGLRLQRSINESQRFSRSFCLKEEIPQTQEILLTRHLRSTSRQTALRIEEPSGVSRAPPVPEGKGKAVLGLAAPEEPCTKRPRLEVEPTERRASSPAVITEAPSWVDFDLGGRIAVLNAEKTKALVDLTQEWLCDTGYTNKAFELGPVVSSLSLSEVAESLDRQLLHLPLMEGMASAWHWAYTLSQSHRSLLQDCDKQKLAREELEKKVADLGPQAEMYRTQAVGITKEKLELQVRLEEDGRQLAAYKAQVENLEKENVGLKAELEDEQRRITALKDEVANLRTQQANNKLALFDHKKASAELVSKFMELKEEAGVAEEQKKKAEEDCEKIRGLENEVLELKKQLDSRQSHEEFLSSLTQTPAYRQLLLETYQQGLNSCLKTLVRKEVLSSEWEDLNHFLKFTEEPDEKGNERLNTFMLH